MTLKNSENNYVEEINNKHNYIYDEYGFLLVDSVEDLIYDRFNNYMGNWNNLEQNQKYKKNKNNDNFSNVKDINQKNIFINIKGKAGRYWDFNYNTNKQNYINNNKSSIISLKKYKNEKNNLNKRYEKLGNNDNISNSEKELAKMYKKDNIEKNNKNPKHLYIKKDNYIIVKNDNINIIRKNINKSNIIKIKSEKNETSKYKNKINFNHIKDNNSIDKEEIYYIKKKNKSYCFIEYKNNYLIQNNTEITYTPYPNFKYTEFISKNNFWEKNYRKFNQGDSFTFGEEERNVNKNITNLTRDINGETINEINNLSKSVDTKKYKIILNKFNNIKKKKTINQKIYNIPLINLCYITKIIKNKNCKKKIPKVISKNKKVFFIKNNFNEKINLINKENRLLILPKSNLCYFKKKYIIINKNHNVPLCTIVNNIFFRTKELVIIKNENIKKLNKIKIIKQNKILSTNKSGNITLQFSKFKKPLIITKTSRNEINCNDTNKINKSQKILFPFIKNKEKYKDSNKIKNIFPLIQNHFIRQALYNKDVNESNIKNENLKYKDVFSQKNFEEYNKMSIKNKLRNIFINNYQILDLKRNESSNSIFPPFLNTIYPTNLKIFNEKNRSKGIPYKESNNDNYQFFPAIHSYFN